MYLDNLTIQHYSGPLVEENVYYPFGLTMTGISSKAAGKTENKKKFNGYEENKDVDLNWYETFYRTHDPQLGRFWQIDPKAIDEISPYAAMMNNPILMTDILGDTTTYYDNQGNVLYTTNVKGYTRAFIISDDYLDGAKAIFGSLGKLDLDQQKGLDGIILALNPFGKFGDAYDLNSINEFYSDNVNKYPIQRIDGISIDNISKIEQDGKQVSNSYIKTIKGAEASFNMTKKGGVWVVDNESVKSDNDLNGSPIGTSTAPNGHLHPNNKFVNGHEIAYIYNGRRTSLDVMTPTANVSTADVNKAKQQGKIGGTLRNIVVTSNAIYFYNQNHYCPTKI